MEIQHYKKHKNTITTLPNINKNIEYDNMTKIKKFLKKTHFQLTYYNTYRQNETT